MFPERIRKFYTTLVIVLIACLVIENPLGIKALTNLTSQELFLYHVKDIADRFTGEEETDGFYLSTGKYEETKDGELFGVAEGRNLIIVQMESLQDMLINYEYEGQEVLPFLDSLIEDVSTIYFNNFYSEIGSGNTSDSEFTTNNSMMGSVESFTNQLYQDNYWYGLPKILKDMGYGTFVYHGFDDRAFWNREAFYPGEGFDRFYSGGDYVNDHIDGIGAGNITGISDHAFLAQTAEKMLELEEPYYSMIITLSAHNPFGLPDYLKEIKLADREDNIVGRYFQSENYADRCLAEFFDAIKENGIYDNSIIVMYGDHFGLSAADENIKKIMTELNGREYTYDEMQRIPLIIHIPGEEVKQTISVAGGQMDLLPTIAYLLGIDTLDTLYFGNNLFNTSAEEGLGIFEMFMLKGSFVKDEIVFEASRDGILENSNVYNRFTREKLNPADYYDDYARAKSIVELSDVYLKNDVLRLVLDKHMTEEQIEMLLTGGLKNMPKLHYYNVAADDQAGMINMFEEVLAAIRNDDSYYAALESDDMLTLLENLQRECSGFEEAQKGVTMEVDEARNADYLLFQRHLYPVADVSDITKAGYMGFGNILIRYDQSLMTLPEYRQLMDSSSAVGMIVDDNIQAKKYLEDSGIYTYTNGQNNLLYHNRNNSISAFDLHPLTCNQKGN